MDEILLYRGCTTPVRLPAYEASTRAVLEKLGVSVIDLENANCCGAQYIESLSGNAFTALCGRLLALAEQQAKDLLAICGACSGSLKMNKHALDNDPALRDEVNALLSEEGLEYTGKVRVRHLLQVFNEDIGYRAIERAIVHPYGGARMAAHYGCHVTRPQEIVQVDDPENPTIIDKIVKIAGATPVDYPGKTRCCGGPMLGMDAELATLIGSDKIANIRAANAEGIVTACAFCDIQLTQVQFGESASGKQIPVIPLPQFLGPAMGIEEDRLGFDLNRISPQPIVSTVQARRRV